MDDVDPGVRKLVELLYKNGIVACNASDGALDGCPHIAIALDGELGGLKDGYHVSHEVVALLPEPKGPEQFVEVTYSPEHGFTMVLVVGYSDEDLPEISGENRTSN